jgi:hypothetical protein
MTVKYYTGGGISSNVAAGELTRINGVEFEESLSSFTRAQLSLYNSAKNSLAVDNDVPAVGGRGGETLEEIRQNALANFGAQNRAVTAKDYQCHRNMELSQKHMLLPMEHWIIIHLHLY